jgi:hypothetical protein
MQIENFPDKEYLILAISAFSGGADEIFNKNYIPRPEDLRKQPVNELMIDNSDGLFDDVDPLLYKGTKGRRLNLTSHSAAEKLNIKIIKK